MICDSDWGRFESPVSGEGECPAKEKDECPVKDECPPRGSKSTIIYGVINVIVRNCLKCNPVQLKSNN